MLVDPKPDWLFYTALELRFCIEQTLRTYLELLRVEWTKPLAKLYRAKDLKQAILNAEPEFVEKLAFVDVLIRAIHPTGVFQLDLDKLNTYYGRLGAYLHAPLYENKTVKVASWWQSFSDLLVEIKAYLKEVLRHPMATFHPAGDGWKMFARWKAGEVTDAEVQQDFRGGFHSTDSA